MNECKTWQGRMIEALYGELGPADKARLERHLNSCPDCAAEYAALNESLRTMDRRERRDPGPGFWDGYWDRLSRRMLWEATEDGRHPSLAARIGRIFSRLPRWSYQAAGAAALVLVGILIGIRLVGPPDRTGKTTATTSASSAAPGAVVQAGDFIERSKALLLGLVNYDPAKEDAYAFDLAQKKAVSRELASRAPAIRNALDAPGQRRLRDLVTDLEVIMMQIANLEAGQDIEGVELIKQGVDRQGLFLKIDLDRMTRDARGVAPTAPPAGLHKKSQA